ncbi:hypothetical protein Vadar_012281 [Vaccinium darrowii]|uniref:Uncharacterized protein n=1 Tax=Vaccinium darrowii TaxID=229202 RepID=A0ACB7X056_9ERIC|nr:hypothetical protein Vadar_012281 [Vaccinium darrowii]
MATPSDNLWLGILSSELTDSDLKNLFLKYGNVHSVTTPNPSRTYAFVYFILIEDAKEAMKGLRGSVLRGNETQIDFAKPGRTSKFLGLCLTLI